MGNIQTMKKLFLHLLFAVIVIGDLLGAFYQLSWIDYLFKSFLLIWITTYFLLHSKIAINKFLTPIPYEGVFVMPTYISAKYLIMRGLLKKYE